MPEPSSTGQYNEKFIIALQWMWGDGYLAPGGHEEVDELLHNVNVNNRHVLDVGSGLGAIDINLVQKYGASSVLGIDVEQHLIEHATDRVKKAGLDEQVTFELVEPGPLHFDDGSFEMVFSKDAIVHIPDKPAFYREVFRILKPTGVFVGSDWLRGGEETYTPLAEEWLEFCHLNFDMRDLRQTQEAISTVGFQKVSLVDRNNWYIDEVKKELATLSGVKYERLVELIGEHEASYRQKSSALKQKVIELGFLRPTHFVAYKPAD